MEEKETKVVLSGVDISFWNLVIFIVKIALASIPALFIIWFVFMLFGAIFGGMFGMFMAPRGF